MRVLVLALGALIVAFAACSRANDARDAVDASPGDAHASSDAAAPSDATPEDGGACVVADGACVGRSDCCPPFRGLPYDSDELEQNGAGELECGERAPKGIACAQRRS